MPCWLLAIGLVLVAAALLSLAICYVGGSFD